MKFSIKDYFSKCDQISNFLRIWSHLWKRSLMENFTFCSVLRGSRGVFKTLPKYIIELSSQENFITDAYKGIKYALEVCDGHHGLHIEQAIAS